MTTTTTTTSAAELDALTEKLAAATAATAEARAELAAAKAARGDATIDGTIADTHSARVLAAEASVDVCLEAEHALSRRRRVLLDDAPPLVSDAGDSRTVRVRILGRAGSHACNQPSTGGRLEGGAEVTLPADDALSLAAGGYVLPLDALPAWWPQTVPVPDEAALRALAGR